MGSITGSVIAAFVLTYLQEFLRFLQDYRLLFYPLILICVMLFRPQGFLGMKEFSFIQTWENAPVWLKSMREKYTGVKQKGGQDGNKK